MKLQITAQAYNLRYLPEEDRVLFAVALSSERDLGFALTRRLTRNVVQALAKLVGQREAAPAGAAEAVRESILDFEHGRAVAEAQAQGNMKDLPREQDKPLAEPPRLVREVQIAPRNHGGIALLFDNGEQVVALEIAPDRIHMVIETFVRMAERVGWDFPPMSGWLEAAKTVVPQSTKSLN